MWVYWKHISNFPKHWGKYYSDFKILEIYFQNTTPYFILLPYTQKKIFGNFKENVISLLDMKPKEILQRWVERFNQYDYEGLSELYSDNAINHQTALGIIEGKESIKQFFKEDFEKHEMVCVVENIFEDGNVGILEWKDPKGLRGCGFFWMENDKIVHQRGYFDKLSFMEQQNK